MKRNGVILIFVFLISFSAFSQQEAQYTQYMYNTMLFNPAYAGSRGVPSFFGMYRSQWVGLDGAPKTSVLSFHAPLESRKIGLGGTILHETIGPQTSTNILIDFSYNLVFEKSKLAFGIKGTAGFFSIDYTQLRLYDYGDLSFEGDNRIFSPNVGMGIYWYSDKYYLGFSIPNLLENNIYERANKTISVVKNTQHMYLMGGYVFELSDALKFKPAVLSKVAYGSPLQLDLSANFMFNDRFVLGGAWRWSAAVSLMAGFQVNDRFFVGYAYDFETTDIARYNSGSHEIFLRYEILKSIKRVISPRFF